LRVAHEQQPAAERVSDGLGANRLAGAWRAGEVEREGVAARVAFAKPPAVEDKRVMRDLREGRVERAAGGGPEDHVAERAPGCNRFDCAAAGRPQESGQNAQAV